MSDDYTYEDIPTGGDIVDAARSHLDSNAFQLYNYNDGVPSGEPKDHQFVSNVLNNVGMGFEGEGDIDKHPSIGDWANPNSTIPGWNTVSGPPQAGDVLATANPIPTHWYVSPGQSIGIATGDGTSIGIRDNNRIAESDFGLQDGHTPTIWRSNYAADAGNAVANLGEKTPAEQIEDKAIRKGAEYLGGKLAGKACEKVPLLTPFKPLCEKAGKATGGYLSDHRQDIMDATKNNGEFYGNIPPGLL